MAKKKDKKNITTLAQYVLVVLMMGGAFWTGTLYQQVRALKATSAKQNTQVAGTGTVGGNTIAAPQVQPEVNLEGDDWTQLLRNPAAAVGNEAAKVVMVEFTDYQCPFCKRAFEETWPKIKSEYIEAGKVRYLVRDLPLSFHANAKPAALSARCAGDQGKYFEMHDKIFENQDEWITGNPDEKLKRYATEIGVNGSEFNSCYDGDKYGKEIEADLALASKVGATGTPTFFINGRQVVGAQPMSAFESVIEEELGK